MNSDGIQTLVMKLRFVQSLPGRSLTRFDFFGPPLEVWRTILRFLEKGFGTAPNHISRGDSNQTGLDYFANCKRNRDNTLRRGSGGGRPQKIP